MWPFLGYTPVSDAPTHTEISSCDEDAPNAGLKHGILKMPRKERRRKLL